MVENFCKMKLPLLLESEIERGMKLGLAYPFRGEEERCEMSREGNLGCFYG